MRNEEIKKDFFFPRVFKDDPVLKKRDSLFNLFDV